jgi:ribosome maturation factor RimP
MKVKPIAEVVEYLRPIAEEVGVEIIDAKWDTRANSLTIFIDAPGGVDLILCEKFHHAIDAPLDEFDPTFGATYTLNCSSPGLDRPFKTQRDFDRHLGEQVEVHLYAPVDGKKYYEGKLLSFDGKTVVIQTTSEEKAFSFEKISKVCLLIEV